MKMSINKIIAFIMSIFVFAGVITTEPFKVSADEQEQKNISYYCDNCKVEKRAFINYDYNVIKKAIGAESYEDTEKVIFNDSTEICPVWENSTLEKNEIKGMEVVHYWFNRDDNDNLYLENSAASVYRIHGNGNGATSGGAYWNFFNEDGMDYYEKSTIDLNFYADFIGRRPDMIEIRAEYNVTYDEYGIDFEHFNYIGYVCLVENDTTPFKFKEINTIQDIINEKGLPYEVKTDSKTAKTFLYGLNSETKMSTIKEELGENIIINDIDSNELNVNDKIGTGCKMLFLKEGGVADIVAIVIKGDTDGNGSIDVLDMEAIQKSILGIGDKLSGAYKEAASLSGSIDISVLDMEAIQKDILGIQKIN